MTDVLTDTLDSQLTKGRIALADKRDNDALTALEGALATAHSSGIRDGRACEILDLLSQIYVKVYRTTDALNANQEAADCAAEHYGADTLETERYMRSLAIVYYRLEQHEQARQLFAHCLSILDSELDANDPKIARLIVDQGHCELAYRGDITVAQKHLERAFSILKQAIPVDDDSLIEQIFSSVDLLVRLDRRPAAITTIESQITKVASSAAKPFALAKLRIKLASLYHKDGRYAEGLIDQIYADIQRLSPVPAADVWQRLAWHFTYEVRKRDKALEALQKALALLQEIFGPDHPKLVEPLQNICELALFIAGMDSSPFNEHLINIFEKTKGPGHPDTLGAYIMLAGQHARTAPERSLPLLRLTADRIQQYGCEDKVVVGNCLLSLATELYARGDFDECSSVLDQCEAYFRLMMATIDDERSVAGYVGLQLLRIYGLRSGIFEANDDQAALADVNLKMELIKDKTRSFGELKALYGKQ